jgi:hypothetical protein
MEREEFSSSKNEFFCLSPFIFSISLTPASLMFSPRQIILNLNFYRGKNLNIFILEFHYFSNFKGLVP